MTFDPCAADAVLTIDLSAITDNYRRLAALAEPARCAPVVKADAYGLGADQVAPALWRAGARLFFVAQLAEAVALRPLLPEAGIAVLNGLGPDRPAIFTDYGLYPVLNSLVEIDRWSEAAATHDQPLPAFIHVDTGMNRLGLPADETARLIATPDRLRGFPVSALISHLACADEAGHPKTSAQRTAFDAMRRQLPAMPASLANSAGMHRGQNYHYQLVRPGCALYGINPTPESANPMRPVARLDSRIVQVRRVDRPETVGYGAAYYLRRKSKIATIPVGYADGYRRLLGNRSVVSVAGATVPVVGRVSMDLITVDVSDLPDEAVGPGTPVRLLGTPGPSVDRLAHEADTIGYEILTGLGRRFARHYQGATG